VRMWCIFPSRAYDIIVPHFFSNPAELPVIRGRLISTLLGAIL
jgi:hypothetical protein